MRCRCGSALELKTNLQFVGSAFFLELDLETSRPGTPEVLCDEYWERNRRRKLAAVSVPVVERVGFLSPRPPAGSLSQRVVCG